MARNPTALGPLTPQDVRYLAFEGGGGKGIAFLGAIQALEDLGVLRYSTTQYRATPPSHLLRWPRWMPGEVDQQRQLDVTGPVKGISGASAGAITALLLSCGYSSADIELIMGAADFDAFFEKPTPRRVPRIGLNRDPSDFESAEEVPGTPAGAPQELKPLLAMVTLLTLAQATPPRPRRGSLAQYGDRLWDAFLHAVPVLAREHVLALTAGPNPALPKVATTLLLDHFDLYMSFLIQDMGLFPGYAARRFFAEVLAFKMPLRNGHRQYNATFADHMDWFGTKLVITGTNVETGKSGLFSVDTTPNFPVADAVRISMSLPLAYKPFVIRPEHYAPVELPSWVDGVWVDGGYLNNLPLHVFDHEPEGVRRTLGLRLDLEAAPRPVESFGDFLLRWPLEFGFMGTGEAQLGPGTRNDTQTVLLDTTGLSLLEFTAPRDVIRQVSARTRAQVQAYFEQPIPAL